MEQALFSKTADQKVNIELYPNEVSEMYSHIQQPDGLYIVTKCIRKNFKEESSKFINHLIFQISFETRDKTALTEFWKGEFA